MLLWNGTNWTDREAHTDTLDTTYMSTEKAVSWTRVRVIHWPCAELSFMCVFTHTVYWEHALHSMPPHKSKDCWHAGPRVCKSRRRQTDAGALVRTHSGWNFSPCCFCASLLPLISGLQTFMCLTVFSFLFLGGLFIKVWIQSSVLLSFSIFQFRSHHQNFPTICHRSSGCLATRSCLSQQVATMTVARREPGNKDIRCYFPLLVCGHFRRPPMAAVCVCVLTSAPVSSRGSADATHVPLPSLIMVCVCVCVCMLISAWVISHWVQLTAEALLTPACQPQRKTHFWVAGLVRLGNDTHKRTHEHTIPHKLQHLAEMNLVEQIKADDSPPFIFSVHKLLTPLCEPLLLSRFSVWSFFFLHFPSPSPSFSSPLPVWRSVCWRWQRVCCCWQL